MQDTVKMLPALPAPAPKLLSSPGMQAEAVTAAANRYQDGNAKGLTLPFTIHDYRNLDEMLRAGRAPSQANRNFGELTESRSWLGMSGGRAAWESYALEGAPEAQKRMEELARQFSKGTPRGTRTRRRAVRGRQGDELDIHSVRSGNLDRAWRRTRREDAKGKAKRITIIYNTMIRSGHKPDQAFYSPAAAAVLCQKLNEGKVQTEIIGVNWCENIWKDRSRPNSLVIRRVKQTSHPLSIANLAVTATAGYVRSAIFGLWRGTNRAARRSLGSSKSLPDDLAHLVFDKPEGRLINVPFFHREDEAKDFITRTLKELNKPE